VYVSGPDVLREVVIHKCKTDLLVKQPSKHRQHGRGKRAVVAFPVLPELFASLEVWVALEMSDEKDLVGFWEGGHLAR
jgi:hypothetical protein